MPKFDSEKSITVELVKNNQGERLIIGMTSEFIVTHYLYHIAKPEATPQMVMDILEEPMKKFFDPPHKTNYIARIVRDFSDFKKENLAISTT